MACIRIVFAHSIIVLSTIGVFNVAACTSLEGNRKQADEGQSALPNESKIESDPVTVPASGSGRGGVIVGTGGVAGGTGGTPPGSGITEVVFDASVGDRTESDTSVESLVDSYSDAEATHSDAEATHSDAEDTHSDAERLGEGGLSSDTMPSATENDCSTVIGELTDKEDATIDDFLDITSARIEKEGDQLKFIIETRGDIPTKLDRPEDTITYLWFVDVDKNPDTGQLHGEVGSEFIVRVVVGEQYGGGFVDVTGSMPGGGNGTVSVRDNHVEISITLEQIAHAEEFNWRCHTFQMINDIHEPGNPETEVISSLTR